MITEQQRIVLQLVADKKLVEIEEGDEHFETGRELLDERLITGVDASADTFCFFELRVTGRGRQELEGQSV